MSNHLNILLISSTDSYNHTLIPLGNYLLNLGHHVKLVSTAKKPVNSHMLKSESLECETYCGNVKGIEKYDFAIYENFFNEKLLRELDDNDVFKIGMSLHIVLPYFIPRGALAESDLVIVQGKQQSANLVNSGFVGSVLPLGSPQFDGLLRNNVSQTENKKVLFLEQHFYPAGIRGKKELAQMLIELSVENPDYQIRVKPRVLPCEEKESVHLAPHLYRFFPEQLPLNLKLLSVHENLVDCIKESEIVLTTFSTAIFPALLMKKKVACIEGFSHEDLKTFNSRVVDTYYKVLPSDNKVHFLEITKKLGELEECSNEYLNRNFHLRNGTCSEQIERLLQVVKQSVPNGKAKFEPGEMTIEDCGLRIRKYEAASEEQKAKEVKHAAFYKVQNKVLSYFYLLNDMSGIRLLDRKSLVVESLNEWRKRLVEKSSVLEFEQKAYEIIHAEVYRFIEESGDFLQELPHGFLGWYIARLFHENRVDEIEGFAPHIDLPDRSLYLALNYKYNNQFRSAAKYFEKFINEALAYDYQKTPAIQSNVINMAKMEWFISALKSGDILGCLKFVKDKSNGLSFVKKLLPRIVFRKQRVLVPSTI